MCVGIEGSLTALEFFTLRTAIGWLAVLKLVTSSSHGQTTPGSEQKRKKAPTFEGLEPIQMSAFVNIGQLGKRKEKEQES